VFWEPENESRRVDSSCSLGSWKPSTTQASYDLFKESIVGKGNNAQRKEVKKKKAKKDKPKATTR